MESIRKTPTGMYFRMDDGRVGYANDNGYARISVAREGLRDGEWFSEPGEISDRSYQINKKVEIERSYEIDGKTYTTNGYKRVLYTSFAAALSALIVYNRNNCQPINVLKRERDTYKSHYQGMKYYNSVYNRRVFGEGVDVGKGEILIQLQNLIDSNNE